MIYWLPRWLRRRHDELPKDYPAVPSVVGAFGNMAARITYGSPSVQTWRAACDLSLARSRARRSR